MKESVQSWGNSGESLSAFPVAGGAQGLQNESSHKQWALGYKQAELLPNWKGCPA